MATKLTKRARSRTAPGGSLKRVVLRLAHEFDVLKVKNDQAARHLSKYGMAGKANYTHGVADGFMLAATICRLKLKPENGDLTDAK